MKPAFVTARASTDPSDEQGTSNSCLPPQPPDARYRDTSMRHGCSRNHWPLLTTKAQFSPLLPLTTRHFRIFDMQTPPA